MSHGHLTWFHPLHSHSAQDSCWSSVWPQVLWGWGLTAPLGAFTREGRFYIEIVQKQGGKPPPLSSSKGASSPVPLSQQLLLVAAECPGQGLLLDSPSQQPPSQVLPDICLQCQPRSCWPKSCPHGASCTLANLGRCLAAYTSRPEAAGEQGLAVCPASVLLEGTNREQEDSVYSQATA